MLFSDGKFNGYKTKPTAGLDIEPLNNFKIERKCNFSNNSSKMIFCIYS